MVFVVTLTDSMALSQRPCEAFNPPLRPCLVYRAGKAKKAFQRTSAGIKVRLAGSAWPICGCADWLDDSRYIPLPAESAVSRWLYTSQPGLSKSDAGLCDTPSKGHPPRTSVSFLRDSSAIGVARALTITDRAGTLLPGGRVRTENLDPCDGAVSQLFVQHGH